MKLHQIRDVVAIAERGSLRSASRHLAVAQSAITRSVRDLEQELGATLFERHASGAVLTPVGEAFVRRAKGIQLDILRAREEVEQMKGSTVGSVSVGLSTAPHIALLPRVMEPFRRRYPEVKLQVSEGPFPSLEARLQDGAVDFYVGPMIEEEQHVDLVVERLFENRRIIVGRRGHPLGFATSLVELADARWIASSVTFDSDAEFGPLFERHGLPKPHVAAQADTALSMVALCAGSDLLALLPQQWLEFLAATELVQQIPVKEILPAPPICAVRRARLPLTPAAEHLCDLFKRAALNHARRLPGQGAAV